ESCRVIEVLYAQGATAHLVFVRRTDTPACRADLAVALASLAGLIDGDVIRENQRAGGGDPQTRAHIEPDLFELTDFAEQGLWRKHDAIADIASDVWMHDAGWDQPQDRLVTVDPQGMAGVVSALEADHALGGLGQPVDDLALAFVTPLGADHHDVLAHFINRLRCAGDATHRSK